MLKKVKESSPIVIFLFEISGNEHEKCDFLSQFEQIESKMSGTNYTNYKKSNMSKAPAPVNPIGNRANKDGCFTLTVRDPKLVVFLLGNGTYTACIGHRKTEKGTEYFYPYIRDIQSGRDLVLQKIYPGDIYPDQDYAGKDIFKFPLLTKTASDFQEQWVKIYESFMEELSRIKEPQLQGKVVKKYIHETEEKIKLGPQQSLEEAMTKNHKAVDSVAIEGHRWSSTVLSVYCMTTEEGEIAMGVTLYLSYPFYVNREDYLKANPGNGRKRARKEEPVKEGESKAEEQIGDLSEQGK